MAGWGTRRLAREEWQEEEVGHRRRWRPPGEFLRPPFKPLLCRRATPRLQDGARGLELLGQEGSRAGRGGASFPRAPPWPSTPPTPGQGLPAPPSTIAATGQLGPFTGPSARLDPKRPLKRGNQSRLRPGWKPHRGQRPCVLGSRPEVGCCLPCALLPPPTPAPSAGSPTSQRWPPTSPVGSVHQLRGAPCLHPPVIIRFST